MKKTGSKISGLIRAIIRNCSDSTQKDIMLDEFNQNPGGYIDLIKKDTLEQLEEYLKDIFSPFLLRELSKIHKIGLLYQEGYLSQTQVGSSIQFKDSFTNGTRRSNENPGTVELPLDVGLKVIEMYNSRISRG